MAVSDHNYCATADHSTNFEPLQADSEHLIYLEASQGLRSFNGEVVGLLPQRGAPLPRPSLVRPTKVISAPKASPATKIHSQAHQADNISSYENGLRTLINSEIWTLEEHISETPMSLENTTSNNFSEEVANFAASVTDPEQVILPDLPEDLDQIGTKRAPAPSVGKSLLLKPAPSSKKKLTTKGNTISIPENDAEAPAFASNMIDPTFELFPDLFNILGQDQAVVELDVPVVIPPQASLSFENIQSNVTDEWNLEKDLPNVDSKPVLNTNAMLSVNPMEAEGVSVNPLQANEDLDKADFDLLEFAMESSGLASTAENDAQSFDPTNIIDLMLNDDITENDQAFLDLVKTDNDNSNAAAAASGGSTVNLDDIQPSTSTKRSWMDAARVVKPEPLDVGEVDPDYVPTPAKRPRGRPRLPRPEPEPPRYSFVNDFNYLNSLTNSNCDFRRPRGRPPTARPFADVSAYEDTSGLSSEEAKDVKYRRMRDLNNAASKRCRLNRKMKFDNMEIEEQRLLAKNSQLKAQVDTLEDQVKRLKEMVLGMVTKVKNEQNTDETAIENFDLDKLVNDTIEDMQQ